MLLLSVNTKYYARSIQFNSIQFNSIQFNSIQFNSIQFNSIQFNSIQFNSIPVKQGHSEYLTAKVSKNRLGDKTEFDLFSKSPPSGISMRNYFTYSGQMTLARNVEFYFIS